MAFQSDKTGRHLRAVTNAASVEERRRLLQAVNHCQGTGSAEHLSRLLLASLGGGQGIGEAGHGIPVRSPGAGLSSVHTAAVQRVARPMQASANEPVYAPTDVSNVS